MFNATAGVGSVIVGLAFAIFALILREIMGSMLGAPKTIKKDTRVAFADLLNYAAVIDDGIIIGKDGSLMCGWFYRGSDSYSASADELNAEALKLNRVFTKLGSGWMLHADSIRVPAPKYALQKNSFFADPICKAIDDERQRYFDARGNSYESVYVMILTYLPPLRVEGKISDLMFDDPSKKSKTTRQQSNQRLGDRTLDAFKAKIGEIESALKTVLTMRRLTTVKYMDESNQWQTQCELLTYVNRCITGLNHPVNLPPVPMYIDSILGSQEFWTGLTPKVGKRFMIPIAITGFPSESMPAMLQILDTLDCEYRWSTRFVFLDENEALGALEKYKKKWKQKVRGMMDQIFRTSKGTINTDALDMANQTEQAINDINTSLVSYGYYTSVIILSGEGLERLTEIANNIVTLINKIGFGARVETVNAVEAYLGSLPSHNHNIRRPMINTLNLAHLLPTASIWSGLPYNPCSFYPKESPALLQGETHGSTPFRLNLHVDDLGHTFMVGPPGSGKSTALAIIAAQFRRYKNSTIYAFDKGNSLLPLTEAAGGLHFDVAGEGSTLAFAPITHIKTDIDKAWFVQWVEGILALQGIVTSPEITSAVTQAINNCMNTGGYTLSDLHSSIQNTRIKAALEPYTMGGAMGHLLDAKSDGLSLSDFTTFEIESLMNLDPKFALPVLEYLFWRIEKSLRGQPGMIILDEAWLMLGHEFFKAKIREWLKVLRKGNCIVLLATQSIVDAQNSGILDVIKEATSTKIYLPNPNAGDHDTRPMYQNMGLNDREINIIANAVRKRQYYYSSDLGKRLFDFALGEVALAFVGNSDKPSITKIKELKAQFGKHWPSQWLKLKGVEDINVEHEA